MTNWPRPLIYVAGPLESSGSVWTNVRNACKAGDLIWELGGMPYIPHLSVTWAMSTDKADARTWEEWMDMCLGMVFECMALYRIPGESKGADKEVEYALVRGIPVLASEEALKEYLAK